MSETPRDTGKSTYNWNLLNGVWFIVLGALAVLLAFSNFVGGVLLFRWGFLALGGVALIFAVRYLLLSRQPRKSS